MKHLLFLGIVFAAFHLSHSDIPEFCSMPYAEGEGTQFIFALHYDMTQDICSPFIYKGDGGNGNRFENERECMRNCSTNAPNVYPTDESVACHFKKAAGQCSGTFLRFYYDSVHAKCKKFLWTGCIGNGNRFFSIESCNTTCAGIHDHGDEEEETEPDTPIAIILGVLLAVVIVALIVTVVVSIVLSMKKSSKEDRKGKSRDSKAESPLKNQGIEME